MRKIRDNLATIIAGTVVLAVLVASFVVFGPQNLHDSGALVAIVHDSDQRTYRLPLIRDTTLTVATDLGTNTIAVQDGEVRITEADCPNGDCLHQLPISRPGQQLICLPHRLWVEIVSPDEPGESAMDTNAVRQDTDVDLVAR